MPEAARLPHAGFLFRCETPPTGYETVGAHLPQCRPHHIREFVPGKTPGRVHHHFCTIKFCFQKWQHAVSNGPLQQQLLNLPDARKRFELLPWSRKKPEISHEPGFPQGPWNVLNEFSNGSHLLRSELRADSSSTFSVARPQFIATSQRISNPRHHVVRPHVIPCAKIVL